MDNEILNCLTWLANCLSSEYVWGKKISEKRKNEYFDSFYSSLRKHIDWNKLTPDDAKKLRFCQWDSYSNLFLIPLWLYPVIPDDLELTSIDGSKTTKKSGIDTDVRFGCLAYGIVFADYKKEMAKKAKLEYQRKWRAENKDKVKSAAERYWKKKVLHDIEKKGNKNENADE